MGFGIFSKHQASYTTNSDGRSFTSAAIRNFTQNILAIRNSFITMALMPSSPDPNMQNLKSGVSVVYDPADDRGQAIFSSTTAGDSSSPARNMILTGSGRGFTWNSVAAWPSEKTVKVLFHNPEDILGLSWTFSGAGAGNSVKGIFRVPVLPNLQYFFAINGASALNPGSTAITEIAGYWSKKMKAFHFYNNAGAVLTNFPELPASLEVFIFAQVNTAMLGAQLIPKIQNCVNLKALLFTNESWGDNSVNIYTPLTGVLDLSFIVSQLQYFSLCITTALTDIVYTPGMFSNIKRLNLHRNTALNASTLLAILNEFLNSAIGEFLQISGCNKTFSRDFSDNDIKPTVTGLFLYGNIITGNIVFTTPKGLTGFRTGNTDSQLLASGKNNMATVNISGLTIAGIIDLSNSRIVNLTLPINTVCTILSLGGNKLDYTFNPNLWTQIKAMTSLVTLNLCTGTKAVAGSAENGQDSTNGIGVIDITGLNNLQTILAAGTKATGLAKLTATLLDFIAHDNPGLTGIDIGTLTNLREVRVTNNSLFNFDFNRAPNIRFIQAAGSGLTSIDLSARSATTVMGGSGSTDQAINADACIHLTQIIFPANAANGVLSIGASNSLTVVNCPMLTSMVNLEKLSYSSVANATGRAFRASGCALNIDFKVGINNWLPAQIQIQDNAMSQINVDLNIDNIYTNRSKWSTTTSSKTLNIGGSNAAPTGVYQAPAGFILGSNDGSPANAKEKVYVLVNNYAWIVNMN